MVLTVSRPMSWDWSWTECTGDAAPVLTGCWAKAGSSRMTLAVGGGGGCCGCHLVGGVLERQVGSFTRWKFVKAFGAWELFVSSSCKLSDASAQTQAGSPAPRSAQGLPRWGAVGVGGVPSQAARLVTQACSPACPLWWGVGTRTWHQEAGGGRRPLKAGDRVKRGQQRAGASS